MISKRILKSGVLVATTTVILMGCDKQQEPIKATDAPAVQQTQKQSSSNSHKSENDLYIERLNKDVKVENPDALLDEVNQEAKKAQ